MSSIKEISLKDVKQHNKPSDLWVIIEDKVYDLTKFRSEHPGGEDTLDDAAGRDATKDFIDVGHSKDAREMMAKYFVGELAIADRKCNARDVAKCAVGALVIGIATAFIFKKFLVRRN